MVVDHPVDAGKDRRLRSIAIAVEHLHGDDRDLLRHPICRPTDCAGDMGSVAETVPVLPAVAEVPVSGHRNPPCELGVGEPQAGVDDVGSHPGTGVRIGVDTVEGARTLVDAVEPPGRRTLFGGRLHRAVPFDRGDVGVRSQFCNRGRIQPGDQTRQVVPPLVERGDAEFDKEGDHPVESRRVCGADDVPGTR